MDFIDKLRRYVGGRGQAYKQLFKGVHAQTVLADLAKFCRVQQHLRLNDDELYQLYTGRPPGTPSVVQLNDED